MKKTTFTQSGFTIIELMVAIVVVATIAMVAVVNVRTLRAQDRDATKKRDINAVYYQLESFHETNGYYPQIVSTKTLKGLDPATLVDSNQRTINQDGGSYTYAATGCKESKCTSYTLTAELEKEAPFIKLSLIR